MTRRISNFAIAAYLAAFISPEPARAVVYNIVAPSSTYRYLPSPEGPGQPGCQPNAFNCLYGIGGSFAFDVDLAANEGRFSVPDIILTGNEGTLNDPAAVESLLINQITPIPLESSAGGTFLFRDPQEHSIEIRVMGDQLTMIGAYDRTAIDGDGHVFDVLAIAIPEPATCWLALAALGAAIPVCRQRQQHRQNRDEPAR
jgi:hypothetical protein